MQPTTRPAILDLGLALVLTLCLANANATTNRPSAGVAPAPWSSDLPVRQQASWKIALAPHVGTNTLDEQIRVAQGHARALPDPRPHLERLGWLYVSKARVSHDDGYYNLAEHCARALQACDAKSCEALLLRGHVAQSLHRFKDAEAFARELVALRELAFDHGLLGDALADQGKLSEAIAAYQRMVDLRPNLQSYSRVAHARWLKGDLPGALEAAELAMRAASPADPESAAWACTRLAAYRLQDNATSQAQAACRQALELMPDCPPALLLQGKMFLHTHQFEEAIHTLQRATAQPLPEYQWALADALRAAGRTNEAGTVERELRRTGAAQDPRTFALFLATRAEKGDAALALRLAERELAARTDVFTHDALAWALLAANRPADAWKAMERALSEGTSDGRLALHAAVIAMRLERNDAADWLERARRLERLLLPSERRHLQFQSSSFK